MTAFILNLSSLVSALAVWRIYDQTGGDGTLLLVHRLPASQNQMSLKTGRFPRKRRRGTPGTAKSQICNRVPDGRDSDPVVLLPPEF